MHARGACGRANARLAVSVFSTACSREAGRQLHDEYFRRMQAEKGKMDGAALMDQLQKKGLTRNLSGTFDADAAK